MLVALKSWWKCPLILQIMLWGDAVRLCVVSKEMLGTVCIQVHVMIKETDLSLFICILHCVSFVDLLIDCNVQWSVKLLVFTTIHWSVHVSVFLDGPEMEKTDDLPDYSVLKLANQSAQLFSSASDGARSTFQPHLSAVVTPKQVHRVLNNLYENKMIASPTHNIYAYMVSDENSFLRDCEDDGETAAGGRLLHLLQILDVRNVLVVVSRWYGGIPLGPDRFKHINSCGRNILIQEVTPTLHISKKKYIQPYIHTDNYYL
uniref:Impact RWD domain protein n=1 Tax=Cyprinus carpio TaxID=7962 RepID=A0A8C1REX3_CYPCA